jgi:chemotaxis protein methyltransferase CheR
MSESLAEVAELVQRETGMVIKPAQLPALAAALRRVAPGLDPGEFLAAVSGGTGRTSLLAHLVDEVTVQETYFFRELRELQTIEWQQLLEGAQESGSGVVRVWVAACATGEEAYSLAILASEALGRDRPPVTILATDVSNAALARAATGEAYSERSVRNLTPDLRHRYLARDKHGRFGVVDSLKSVVRFRHHNLIGDPSPPLGEVPFDLIACRNVLIYFDLATVRRVLDSLEGALRPEGQLILGAADRLTGTVGVLAAPGAVPAERRRRPGAKKRSPRRPLGLEPRAAAAEEAVAEEQTRPEGPRRRAEDRIDEALAAADEGDLTAARQIVDALLAEDVLLADAYFVRGLVELEASDPRAAVMSLRRCLYVDPGFGLAAFELGRAHAALGDERAARRAYERSLRTLDPEDGRHRAILDQVDLGDVAAACAARLSGPSGVGR